MSQDELHTAICVARKIYREGSRPVDETLVVLCALVRAVELLAERQDKLAADKRIEELEHEQRECLSLITESLLVMPGRTLLETVKDLLVLHGYAAKKITELEKDKRRAEARVRAWEERTGESGPSAPRIVGAKLEPVSVDGKTPGQVWDETYTNALRRAGFVRYADWNTTSPETRDMAEEAAIAVLRAFGQPSQTPLDATDALRRVREHVGKLSNSTDDQSVNVAIDIVRDDVFDFIDEELAKLEAKPAQSPPDTSTESGLPDAVLQEKPRECLCHLDTNPANWPIGAIVVQCKGCGMYGVSKVEKPFVDTCERWDDSNNAGCP